MLWGPGTGEDANPAEPAQASSDAVLALAAAAAALLAVFAVVGHLLELPSTFQDRLIGFAFSSLLSTALLFAAAAAWDRTFAHAAQSLAAWYTATQAALLLAATAAIAAGLYGVFEALGGTRLFDPASGAGWGLRIGFAGGAASSALLAAATITVFVRPTASRPPAAGRVPVCELPVGFAAVGFVMVALAALVVRALDAGFGFGGFLNVPTIDRVASVTGAFVSLPITTVLAALAVLLAFGVTRLRDEVRAPVVVAVGALGIVAVASAIFQIGYIATFHSWSSDIAFSTLYRNNWTRAANAANALSAGILGAIAVVLARRSLASRPPGAEPAGPDHSPAVTTMLALSALAAAGWIATTVLSASPVPVRERLVYAPHSMVVPIGLALVAALAAFGWSQPVGTVSRRASVFATLVAGALSFVALATSTFVAFYVWFGNPNDSFGVVHRDAAQKVGFASDALAVLGIALAVIAVLRRRPTDAVGDAGVHEPVPASI